MRNVVAWTVNPKAWILSSLEEPKRIETEKEKNSQIGSRMSALHVVRCCIDKDSEVFQG